MKQQITNDIKFRIWLLLASTANVVNSTVPKLCVIVVQKDTTTDRLVRFAAERPILAYARLERLNRVRIY